MATDVPQWSAAPAFADDGIDLQWHEVAGASAYIVEITARAYGADGDDGADGADVEQVYVESTAPTLDDLPASQEYHFRVAVADASTGERSGDWSQSTDLVRSVDASDLEIGASTEVTADDDDGGSAGSAGEDGDSAGSAGEVTADGQAGNADNAGNGSSEDENTDGQDTQTEHSQDENSEGEQDPPAGETSSSGSNDDNVAPRTDLDTLRAGTFNVAGVFTDPEHAPNQQWAARLPVVVDQITRTDLDVVGVQEANPVDSGLYAESLVGDNSQFLDVRDALRDNGPWEVTDTERHGANDNRIYYRTDRLQVLDYGSHSFTNRIDENDRTLAWARFRQVQTGAEFMFVTTHLSPADRDLALRQAQELRDVVAGIAGDLPVVIGGDFNASKFTDQGEAMLALMAEAGWSDTLGHLPGTWDGSGVRANEVINGQYSTYNGFDTSVDVRPQDQLGSGIDYIFASDEFEVERWKLVGNFDGDRQQGTIASDHFLLVADLSLG